MVLRNDWIQYFQCTSTIFSLEARGCWTADGKSKSMLGYDDESQDYDAELFPTLHVSFVNWVFSNSKFGIGQSWEQIDHRSARIPRPISVKDYHAIHIFVSWWTMVSDVVLLTREYGVVAAYPRNPTSSTGEWLAETEYRKSLLEYF